MMPYERLLSQTVLIVLLLVPKLSVGTSAVLLKLRFVYLSIIDCVP
jgi:hypothetical protein